MNPKWEVFLSLCEERKIKPTTALKEMGLNPSIVTYWGHGQFYPKADKIIIMAKYFGVSQEVFYDV